MSATSVLMGTAMAFAAGAGHWPSALCALIGAACLHLGTNLVNDYGDAIRGADTVERLGPTRALQSGQITLSGLKRACFIVFLAALVPGLYLVMRGGWLYVLIGVAAILAGVLYTAGPYPLGYLGLGDLLVLVFFGPVAVAGTYSAQTLQFNAATVVAGLSPGLIAVGVLTINNLRDIESDRAAGKRTLPVRFGLTFGRLEYVAAMLVAVVLAPLCLFITSEQPLRGVILAACFLVLCLPMLKTVLTRSDESSLNAALARTCNMAPLFGIAFSVCWLL